MSDGGSIKHFDQVTVMPLRQGRTGVFLNGEVIEETLLTRSYGRIHQPADLVEPVERFDAETIFAGHLQDHFGHFLLEGLARLWHAKAHPALPIAWIGDGRYQPWQIQVLDLLGIRNAPIFISRPTAIRRLIVPEAGYVVQTRFEPWHAEFLGVFPNRPVAAGKKVWLSRSALPETSGNIVNQREIESRLSKAGWSILHPQLLSITDQLACIADAERIAGISGSAFHSFVLMSRLEASIDIFLRGPRNQNYATIARVKGLRQREHTISSVAVTDGPQTSLSKFRWPVLDPIFAALA